MTGIEALNDLGKRDPENYKERLNKDEANFTPMRRAPLVAVAIAILAVASIAVAWYFIYVPLQLERESASYYDRQLAGYYTGGPSGMMSGFQMMGYYNGYLSGYSQEVLINKTISVASQVPGYARVFPQNDTIMFNSTHINLVVIATMVSPSDIGKEVNLTGMLPSSSATANVFVIYGLVNPTLIMPRGASVTFTVINLDPDDYHNLAITPVPPPYPYYSMMYIMMDVLGVSPMLPPASYSSGVAYGLTFTVAFTHPGALYYVCEYPGHAESGMYGEIIVG